ncbi:MAG: hypothetical protein E7B61_10290, partial [Clostridiales bacterium]|nr:hypothetical protein [Clostridiales bacterium]
NYEESHLEQFHTFQKLLFLPAKNVILHLRIIAQFFFFLYNYFLFVQKNNRFYHLFPFFAKINGFFAITVLADLQKIYYTTIV